jgi:hypothetical protein
MAAASFAARSSTCSATNFVWLHHTSPSCFVSIRPRFLPIPSRYVSSSSGRFKTCIIYDV